MIEIVNRQRRRKINARQWRVFADEAMLTLGRSQQSATISPRYRSGFCKSTALPHIRRQSHNHNDRNRQSPATPQDQREAVACLCGRSDADTWQEPTKRDDSIVFVADEAIKKLNRQFRGKNYATDALSFPSEPEAFEVDQQKHLGEVVISVQRAAAQARDNGVSFSNEVKQLILHGLLHLSGYDHETDKGQMNRLELKLRKQLRI